MPRNAPPAPRWVKVAGAIAAVAIVVVVVLHLAGAMPGMMHH